MIFKTNKPNVQGAKHVAFFIAYQVFALGLHLACSKDSIIDKTGKGAATAVKKVSAGVKDGLNPVNTKVDSITSALSTNVDVDSDLPPSLLSLLPPSGTVNPLPKTVTANFDRPLGPLGADIFALSGNCATAAKATVKISEVSLSADGRSAIATLAGSCSNGSTLSVSVDPSKVTNTTGASGTEAVQFANYLFNTSGPTVSLGTPSSTLLNSAGKSTIAIIFKDSVSGGTKLSSGADALTSSGGGLSAIASPSSAGASAPTCAAAVSTISAKGALITLSSCSGNGTYTLQVKAGVAADALGNLSADSAVSAVITIDNTPPTLAALTPASSEVYPAPTAVVASFSKAVAALTAANFVVSGSCTSLPTVSSVAMSNDAKTATANLSSATCSNTQTVVVTVDPTSIKDLAGNAGSAGSIASTYTVITAPHVAFDSSTLKYLNANSLATITYSYVAVVDGTTVSASSSPVQSDGTGITMTPTNGNPSCPISVAAISSPKFGGTITLGPGCSGQGTFNLHINAGTAKDTANTLSLVSPDITIAVQTNKLTASIAPVTGKFELGKVPANITITYSVPVLTSASDYQLSGTCSTIPRVAIQATSIDIPTKEITIPLTGASCTYQQTLSLAFSSGNKIQDFAGNLLTPPAAVTLTSGGNSCTTASVAQYDEATANAIPYCVKPLNWGSTSSVPDGQSLQASCGFTYNIFDGRGNRTSFGTVTANCINGNWSYGVSCLPDSYCAYKVR